MWPSRFKNYVTKFNARFDAGQGFTDQFAGYGPFNLDTNLDANWFVEPRVGHRLGRKNDHEND